MNAFFSFVFSYFAFIFGFALLSSIVRFYNYELKKATKCEFLILVIKIINFLAFSVAFIYFYKNF